MQATSVFGPLRFVVISFALLAPACQGPASTSSFSEKNGEFEEGKTFDSYLEHDDFLDTQDRCEMAAYLYCGGAPRSTPAPISAVTDLRFSTSPCSDLGPTYTQQGVNGIYRLCQNRSQVSVGGRFISDVLMVSGFLGSPYILKGTSCLNGGCVRLYVLEDLFYGDPVQKIVNSSYCARADDIAPSYCQNAPAPIDPPSQIFRPTPTRDIIWFFSGSYDCHDMFVEMKVP